MPVQQSEIDNAVQCERSPLAGAMANGDLPPPEAFDPVALMQRALDHHRGGRAALARQHYDAVLQQQPLHADANHNRAVLLLDDGQYAQALQGFERAVQAQPGNWQYWISHLDALMQAGQPLQAARQLEQARRIGLSVEARDELMQRLLQIEPCPPADDGPHAALGRAAPARRESDSAENLNALGHQWSEMGRLVEAEYCFRRAAALEPGLALVHSNLGMALQRQGRAQDAVTVLLEAVRIDPDLQLPHLNLSVCFDALGRPDEAMASAQMGLQLDPESVLGHNQLAYLLLSKGQCAQARQSLERALAIDPQCASAHSNLLFLLNYDADLSAQEIYRAYQAFDARFGLPLQSTWSPHANSRQTDRRLRLAYVCPELRRHSSRHFLEPLLARHDHARYEIVAYGQEAFADAEVVQRYSACFDHWVVIDGMSDQALAQRIRADGIDVLVDLAGHTRGNRLGAFACKPAPVSLHWLDFGYTTGMSAIDYYLTDEATVPPGNAHLFAEAPWHLPVPALVYRPGADMGEPAASPCVRNGHITFGSLTRAIRINHRTLAAWADLLRQLPDARLVIDSADFRSESAQRELLSRFEAQGIAAARLDVGFHSPPWDVLRGIDIGLDCFPHNCGTTLFEMLYMGVPYVSLAGRASVGRLGGSILQAMGLQRWVAQSQDEYVQLALELAADRMALAQLRRELRPRMLASPLMDEIGFAGHVEQAYVQMFARWSAARVEAAIDVPTTDAVGLPTSAPIESNLQEALEKLMQTALQCHRGGQLEPALQCYQAVLALAPAHADASHNLAVIVLETGDPKAALPHFRHALAQCPGNWQYWLSLFDCLIHSRDLSGATALLERKRRAGMPVAALGELIERLVQCRFTREAAHAKKADAVRSGPARHGKVRSRRGVPAQDVPPARRVQAVEALFRDAQMEQVVAQAQGVCRQFPRAAFGWKALGAALVNLGRFDEALAPLQQAVDCASGDAGALSNLGFALQNRRRPVEAEVNLRLALRYRPDFAAALMNLGATALSQDRFDEAEQWYRAGLALEPDYVPGHSHLAQVLDEQGRLVEAVAGYRQTLALLESPKAKHQGVALDVTRAHAHQGASSSLAKLSDYADVVTHSNAALAAQSEDANIWERRLYAFSYHPDLPVEKIFDEFVRWGNRFPLPAVDFSHHDRTPGRRIRVGYVSPDFRRHTSRFYFLPFFSNHDHAQVELFAYSNVKQDDEYTARFRQCFDHWRDIRDVDDDSVARLVRADGIDILVDGCNHMRDDRLGVFTRKPAPIQVTWLGAAWTTGLEAVDYVLFDPHIAPPETLAREKIVRLPHCFVPFQSLADTDLPQPPPSLAKGHVTFAYSGRSERLNHHTFRVWGEILRRMPTARLVLDYRHFAEPHNRVHFLALMQQQGLDTTRVELRNSPKIFTALHEYDILLDCFPHSGGTMLVDALWMGVPALTLASRPPLGRIGTSFITNIGLPQWVAYSEEEYIAKACAFGADTAMRVALRAGMRQRMLDSHLMDGAGFARGVEQAYRTMWQRFCDGEAPSALTLAAPEPEQP